MSDCSGSSAFLSGTAGRRCQSDLVRLNAATGGAGPLSSIPLTAPIPVVSVAIDTERMREPSVLLNFTSLISLPLGISVALNFELKRSLNNGAPVSIGSTYTFTTLAGTLESRSFGFQYFDSELAPGLYTYAVQLSASSVIDTVPGLTLNNATLSALAVDQDA